MSSLIFMTDADQAFVATDTLAVSPGGQPLMFTSKAFFIPHLKLIMAGTGVGGFLDRWMNKTNTGMIVSGVDALNNHATAQLRTIWAEYKEEGKVTPGMTTTVYHFGFSPLDNAMKGFAYRSENDFASDPISYGIGVKPACEVKDDVRLPDDLMAMMMEQRSNQEKMPAGKRLFIGGEIIVYHLARAGCQIYTREFFPDYVEDTKAIYARFDKNGKHS